MSGLAKQLADDRKLIVKYLEDNFPKNIKYGQKLWDSMRYSLLGDGKRIRPLLFINILRAAGIDEAKFLSFAAAIETLHCYTLIHDDLPALDNDDLRRGRPTNHKLFGEATAILAGDALLTLCFEFAARKLPLAADAQLEMISRLSHLAGYSGLIAGQQADIDSETATASQTNGKLVEFIHHHKTGSLVVASIECAAIAAELPASIRQTLVELAVNLGLHFQIIDDILGFSGSEKVTGKSVSDSRNKKLTYPSFYGIKEARKKARLCLADVLTTLNKLPAEYQILSTIINYLANRQK